MNRSAFTFIEMLAVVTIVSLLAVLGIMAYANFAKQSRDAKRQSDLAEIKSALEMYKADNNTYPTPCPTNSSCNGLYFGTGALTGSNGQIYMSQLPQTPKGSNYLYTLDQTTKIFTLSTTQENGSIYSINSYGIQPTIIPTATPTPVPPLPTPTPRNFKYVFVSTSTHDGNLGGLSGADAICQQDADNGGVPGTYKAWLSDSTTSPNLSPPSRLFTHADIAYKRYYDGVKVAYNWSDLTDGTLVAPIDLTITDVVYEFVRTNTSVSGDIKDPSQNCNDWTSNSTQSYCNGGYTTRINNEWTENWGCNCSSPLRIYCIEQ